MANLILNSGKWGPIEEGSGAIREKPWDGRQIEFKFDNATDAGIHYTAPVGVPISTSTEFIWNTETVDCATDTDMEVFWQGTDDPSVARAGYGSGATISASDTGWTTVSIKNMAGSNAADVREVVRLDSVANVVAKKYVRFKFVLTAGVTPGDVTITCRLGNIPIYGKINYDTAVV